MEMYKTACSQFKQGKALIVITTTRHSKSSYDTYYSPDFHPRLGAGRVLQRLPINIRPLSGYKVLLFFKIFESSQPHESDHQKWREKEQTVGPHSSPHSIRYCKHETNNRQTLKEGGSETKYCIN